MARYILKDAIGQMIFKNSLSNHVFSILVDVDEPNFKRIKIFSDSPEIPDISLSVNDVIEAIYKAYMKAGKENDK